MERDIRWMIKMQMLEAAARVDVLHRLFLKGKHTVKGISRYVAAV